MFAGTLKAARQVKRVKHRTAPSQATLHDLQGLSMVQETSAQGSSEWLFCMPKGTKVQVNKLHISAVAWLISVPLHESLWPSCVYHLLK